MTRFSADCQQLAWLAFETAGILVSRSRKSGLAIELPEYRFRLPLAPTGSFFSDLPIFPIVT